MALDDYGYGKGLFDLIKSGQLKEAELDNSEKVKLRSYKVARTGKGVSDLLAAGQITQQEIDTDPELKLGLQAYNTQKGLEKSGPRRFAEALPETLGEAGKGIAKGLQMPGGFRALQRPEQIDLSQSREPNVVEQAIGERLPQGVVNVLETIQPTLARGGEYLTGESLKLPKTHEPNMLEDMIGFAIGVTPQLLIGGEAIAPSMEAVAAKYGLSAFQKATLSNLVSNLLATSARTGLERYMRAKGADIGSQAEEIGQLGVMGQLGDIAGKGLTELLKPGTFEAVPGFREGVKRAEAMLIGTPDELPVGAADELADIFEAQGRKAAGDAFEEIQKQFQAPRAPDTPRAAFEAPTEPAAPNALFATKTQPRVVIPEEFQTPATRRTPLEQEFGLPKGSEAPKTAKEPVKEPPSEAPPEPVIAPPRAEVPESRAEVPLKAPESPKETYGLEEKHIRALRDREADAAVIADLEDKYGISISRKAKSEVLDAEKVAAVSDEITAGRTPKDTKITRAERKADPALENLLNSRAQKNARAAAREKGISDEDFKVLRKDLGESAIAEETASGAISARRERVIRTILDKSTSIDDDTRALLRSELEDVQKSRTAAQIEQPIPKGASVSGQEPVSKKDIFTDKINAARAQINEASARGIGLDEHLAQNKDLDGTTRTIATILDDNKDNPELVNRFLGRLDEAEERVAEISSDPKFKSTIAKANQDDILETVVRRIADEENIGTATEGGVAQGAPLNRQSADAGAVRGKTRAPKRARESAAVSQEVLDQFREAQELGDAGTNTRALLDPTSTHNITRETGTAKQDFIDKNVKEALQTLKEKSEKGAITFEVSRENVSPKPGQIKSPNPEIEAAMTASKRILPKMQKLIDAVKNNPLTRQYKAWFNWEPLLQKNHKDLLPEFRRFAGKHYDVNELSRTEVFAVVHPLLKDTSPKDSLETASRYIAAQNMKYDIETTGRAIFDEAGEEIGKGAGRTIRDIPLDEVNAEIKRLEGLFTPNVRKQLELHKQLVRLNWKELVYERGLSNSPEPPNEWYFRKEILDYAQRYKEFQPFVSRKLAAPIRPYLMPRTGSVRDINMDYLDVMQRSIARLQMDKAVEDFAKEVMERKAVPVKEMIDAVAETWRIPKADVAKLHIEDILVPGNIYHHGDKIYKVFRYRTSREIFGGAGVTEKFLGDIITSSDAESSLLASKKGRTALLDIDLAERLEQFNQPKELGMLERTIGGPTRAWKRFIINASGIAFQTTQVAGDFFLGFGLERPGAIRQLPRAFRAMMNGRKGIYDEVFDAFMKERLTDAGYIGEYGPTIADPRFKPFQTKSQWAGKKVSDLLAADPLGWLHALNEIREGTERGALYLSYMKDVKAYQAAAAAGKNPKLPRSKMLDLEGILVEDIPGEVARRALVDYNRITPQYASQIRGTLLPFITYYIQSTGNMARYIAKNPVEATWKLALPYAATHLWNNHYYGDIESDMPLDQRIKPHLITGLGYKDKPLIIQWQLPWDTLISVTGLGNAVDNIRKVAKGEMTHEEAFKGWLKSIPKNTADLFVGLLNPFIGRSIDLIRNKDSYTGKEIVPEKEMFTTRGAKKQADYLATKLFRTYNEIRGWTTPVPSRGRPTNTWGLTSYSLEGLLHYKPADEEYRKYGRFSNTMQKAIDLDVQQNDKRARLVDAYIEWQSTGDKSAWTGQLEAIKNEPGPTPSAAQIRAAIQNVNTRIEIVRRKWVKATGPERDKLEAQYNRLLEQRRHENILRKPKAIRPYLFDSNEE